MKKVIRLLPLVLAVLMVFSLAACNNSANTSTAAPGASSSPSAPAGTASPSASPSASSPASGTPPASATGTEPTAKRVLRVGTLEQNGSFNPWVGVPMCCKALVYEAITIRTGTDAKPENLVAKSITWLDGTTLQVTLRDDVYFQDGDQMLAEDVLYAFEQQGADPFSPMASIFSNFDFDNSTISADGLTVTFKMKQEYGPIDAYFDMPYIVNKSACENWDPNDERWWDAPSCSGPYKVVENVAGSHVTLDKDENYWNKSAFPLDWDEITFISYSDETAMFIAYEAGEIDVALGISSDDIARIDKGQVKNANTAKYNLVDSNAALLLCLNPSKPEFQDVKVREAIANAIDRDAMGDVAYGGMYNIVDSVICPATNYYVSCGKYDKGLDYAKQCMAESGYPKGFDVNVVAYSADAAAWEVVQDDLRQIGINVNLNTYDLGTCIPMWMQPGGTDIMTITVAGGNILREPFADLSANCAQGPYPAAQVLDPGYNETYNKFVYNNDTTIRAAACADLQKWLYDNIQVIPLVDPIYAYAYRSDVISECDFFSATTRANFLFCYAA